MHDFPDVRLLSAASHACSEQADTLQQTLARVHAATSPPAAPSSHDERALLRMVRSRDRQDIWAGCVLSALSIGVHVADHVRSLGLLLSHMRESGAPVYAHASLARGAVESVAWLTWLLADGEPFDVRLGRGVAFLVEDAALAVKAAGKVPGTAYLAAPVSGEQAKEQALFQRLDNALIDRVPDVNGARIKGVRVNRGGTEFSTNIKISALVPQAFPDLPALYDLLSGVAHARAWGLTDSVTGQGRNASWRANPIAVSNSALTCLLAAQRAGKIFASYRGFPDDHGITEMAQRHAKFDRAMVEFGRSNGYLAGVRPIDGFLT